MASSSSSFCLMPESACEGVQFSSEANKMLLMALMEETHEDQCCADDRLMSMIQSLEAEISFPSSGYDDMEVGQVGDQDWSTSSISFSSTDWDQDMEVAYAISSSSSSSPFDEEMMMNEWSLCAADGDDSGHYCSSEIYYDGLLLENCLLPQETSDVVVL